MIASPISRRVVTKLMVVLFCAFVLADAQTQQAEEISASSVGPTTGTAPSSSTAAPFTAAAPDGKELFHREWIAHDPRSHGGDGLGPVFNDSSCIACHNQGGSGGGGPASKNVDIISAFVSPTPGQQIQQQPANQTVPCSPRWCKVLHPATAHDC